MPEARVTHLGTLPCLQGQAWYPERDTHGWTLEGMGNNEEGYWVSSYTPFIQIGAGTPAAAAAAAAAKAAAKAGQYGKLSPSVSDL